MLKKKKKNINKKLKKNKIKNIGIYITSTSCPTVQQLIQIVVT